MRPSTSGGRIPPVIGFVIMLIEAKVYASTSKLRMASVDTMPLAIRGTYVKTLSASDHA
jgi:hypothetical protein